MSAPPALSCVVRTQSLSVYTGSRRVPGLCDQSQVDFLFNFTFSSLPLLSEPEVSILVQVTGVWKEPTTLPPECRKFKQEFVKPLRIITVYFFLMIATGLYFSLRFPHDWIDKESMSLTSRIVSGQTFSRIAQQTNFCCQILDAFNAKVTVPGGFPYEAYNSKAYIQPWSVLKMVEYARSTTFSNESFLDFGKLYNKYFVFIASTSTRILPELYDACIKKSPLELHVKLSYTGTTTFKTITTISLQGTGTLLFENATQSVCVHNETRKPSPLPDWWKEKYSAANGEPLKLSRLTVPENVAFTEQHLQVQASEVDPYMHINWTNFVKYCHDAFVMSQLQKYPDNIAGHMFRNAKSLSAAYIKESNLGDFITVRFWPDSVNVDVYNFQVLKDAYVLCECCIEYYPSIVV